MYPVVFFDALRVKIRDDGGVSNKAVYLALGVQADGQRDVLGLWVEQTEGAKFWLKVFNELKTRGCQDILIAVIDGRDSRRRSEAQAAQALPPSWRWNWPRPPPGWMIGARCP